jgi:hypothetical protein
MGNVNSDQRTKPNETSSKGRRMTFAARQIPKYLKPTKPKERERRPSATTRSKSSSKEKAVQFADLHDEQHYDSEHHLPNMLVTGMSDDHGRDTEQSANFRWIKGRRFTDTQVGVVLCTKALESYTIINSKLGYQLPLSCRQTRTRSSTNASLCFKMGVWQVHKKKFQKSQQINFMC